MNNAFNILGAEPTDTAERLQELLDEKELLIDDVSEVQAAYADLTNPKKRVQHEILYFCSGALEDFNKLVNRDFEETPSVGKIANIVVELGWWFESDDDELFERINNAREESGFTHIEDVDTVSQAVQSLKQDCIQSVNTYFDRLKEKSLVGIFNQIVKIEDYESFFIDELMAHYELIVNEVLQEKEQECTRVFNEIERICNQFNKGDYLSSSLSQIMTKFSMVLKDWDNYAQPLQVNMQKRGGQHEGSNELVHDLRNHIIEICNKSQESLSKSLESFQSTSRLTNIYGSSYSFYNERDKLENRLNDSIDLTNALITLIDILSRVFAELEMTAEQLKKDRNDLSNLRDTLTSLRNQIPGAQQRALSRSSQGITTSTTTKPTNSYQIPSQSSSTNGHNGYRILLGLMTAICVILMIEGFSIENIAMGIAFIILGLAFGIGCGAFYMLKENKKALLAVVLVPIVLILAVVVPVASCSSKEEDKEIKLSSANFETYFSVSSSGPSSGRSVTVNYSVSPKKSSYSATSTITLKVKITVRSSRYSTLRKSETVSVTLNKSSGYKKSGSVTISLSSSASYSSLYYDTEVMSCSGTLLT